MVKKINISPVLFIVSLFLIFTIINLTAARNTTHSTLAANGHAARFHVTIDGAPTSTVNNKIYATSKISDIQQSGEVYTGGSFIDGAYQANSIVIHNDSDTIMLYYLIVQQSKTYMPNYMRKRMEHH